MIPYSCQQIDESDIAAVVAVLRSEYLTQGPEVPAFEAAFAERHEVGHAVAVGSATTALHLACLALGVGPGSRVWTSPNSFLASANAPLACGAEVDFVDIERDTRNLSAATLAARLEAAAAAGTLPQVVIPVDFAGLPCDWRELRALADRFGFALLQDASHATGATYQGRPVGAAWADATVFSFHAVKVVTTAEGGMVTTRDPALAAELRLLRSHGMTRDALRAPAEGPWVYEQHRLGFNGRMTELQAALGRSQLRRLASMHARRIELAERYDEQLAALPLRRPARRGDRVSSWHLYAIEIERAAGVPSRAEVFAAMRRADIGVNVHYIPIPSQPFWRERGHRAGACPQAEAYYAGALSLPLHPSLTDAEQGQVVDALERALCAAPSLRAA